MTIDDKAENRNHGGFARFMADHPQLRRGATLLTVLAALGFGSGCGGSGGDDDDEPVPQQPQNDLPEDPTPTENYIFNFEEAASLMPLYTQSVAYPQGGDAINEPLTYGVNIADTFKVSMSEDVFKTVYLTDQVFADELKDVYRTALQALNPGLTDAQANAEVDNLVNSITNNNKTDLDNNYDQVVFFGYIPDGMGGQKPYIAFSIVDENGNESIIVAVNGDRNVSNSSNLANIDALVADVVATYGAPQP